MRRFRPGHGADLARLAQTVARELGARTRRVLPSPPDTYHVVVEGGELVRPAVLCLRMRRGETGDEGTESRERDGPGGRGGAGGRGGPGSRAGPGDGPVVDSEHLAEEHALPVRRVRGGTVQVRLLEHLPAGSLAGRMAAGPLSVGEAVTILLAVAEVMHAAHGSGCGGIEPRCASIRFRDDGCPVVAAGEGAGPLTPERAQGDAAAFLRLVRDVTAAVADGRGADLANRVETVFASGAGGLRAAILAAAPPAAVQLAGPRRGGARPAVDPSRAVRRRDLADRARAESRRRVRGRTNRRAALRRTGAGGNGGAVTPEVGRAVLRERRGAPAGIGGGDGGERRRDPAGPEQRKRGRLGGGRSGSGSRAGGRSASRAGAAAWWDAVLDGNPLRDARVAAVAYLRRRPKTVALAALPAVLAAVLFVAVPVDAAGPGPAARTVSTATHGGSEATPSASASRAPVAVGASPGDDATEGTRRSGAASGPPDGGARCAEPDVFDLNGEGDATGGDDDGAAGGPREGGGACSAVGPDADDPVRVAMAWLAAHGGSSGAGQGSAVITQRWGEAVLVTVRTDPQGGPDSEPASLLLVRGEAGWRIRAVYS
ncbi:hypothetical protein [Leifsonia aquatica]|uniref:hypothetical protein n=1 Tax=Leifsonia aquatica TaxID=144185 RepID=UPI000AEE106A|nr:hypothetical protein [Leifsonia aquatica]